MIKYLQMWEIKFGVYPQTDIITAFVCNYACI